jgi:CheY-like chemotaxis protein
LARKILLADDSVTAQNMGRKILTDAGYDVVTVNNGSAALKRVAEVKPDLIVLDVYMPGYSGLEVCQRLKDAGETAHIPVLLTVGKLEPFKAEEGRRVRADSHIVKPFEASELLTAITRLEDRLVPAAAERFIKGSNRPAESNTDADTGWKSRLSFASKKKKEEPEPDPEEEVTTGANFRDFRKAKGKAGATGSPTPTGKASPPAQEPGPSADVPRDITQEEMDAISALASKLNGETPGAELATAKTEVGVFGATAEAKEIEGQAEVVYGAAAPVEVSAFAVEGKHVEGKSEVEIPVQCVELASEPTAVVEPLAIQTPQTEAPLPESPVSVEVNTALLAQEAAPVDRDDEPTFASSASAITSAAEEKTKTETETEEMPDAAIVRAEILGTSTPVEAVALKDLESPSEESTPDKTAQPVPFAMTLREAGETPPSDAELVEALRLLTPATGYADLSMVPSPGTLAVAGQLLAEEAARNAAAAPRWVAQPMTLSSEEAAISLEAEMIFALAAKPAAASGSEAEGGRITGVSAIAAAVENRLAEAESAVSQQTVEHYSAEPDSAEPGAEIGAAETPVEAPAATTADWNPATLVGSEVERLALEKIEALNSAATPSNAVEEAKQPELAAEETPKAMAAAAAAESSAGSATDARTIASIVDSVMADLRPRIVEEIARKLAKRD